MLNLLKSKDQIMVVIFHHMRALAYLKHCVCLHWQYLSIIDVLDMPAFSTLFDMPCFRDYEKEIHFTGHLLLLNSPVDSISLDFFYSV